jgi:membrane protein
MIGSLNIIYEQEDRRSLIRTALIAAALAGGAVIVGLIGIVAASMLNARRDVSFCARSGGCTLAVA